MYPNSISRTHINRIPKSRPRKIYIRRSKIAYEPRSAYIESVFAILIESRFGPGSSYEPSAVVVDQSDHPELEPVPLYDLCGDEADSAAPSFAFSSLGRAGYRVDSAARRAKQMGPANVGQPSRNSPTDLTPNQGRGSP
jgi:hypothetical protein